VLSRRHLAALLAALPFTVQAQQPTAQAFLQSIYAPYQESGFKGQPYWEPARFFAPDLAAAIDQDMKLSKQRGEPPALNGDPFVDAQEWRIIDLTMVITPTDDSARADVSFKNLDRPKTLTVTLARTPQGWRISDILGANGSLRELYKLR
jgi:hypothetical protein